jgi:hypothetical protein
MSSARKDSSPPIPERGATDADGWQCRERLNKSEAEKLLDWLEANGCSQKEVTLVDDGSFRVRWRR